MQQKIKDIISSSISVKQSVLGDETLLSTVEKISTGLVKCLKNGNRIYFCGNGGSAADAQHLAAEFSGRFYADRRALPAEALHCNTSYLTAVANDYSYDVVYARLIDGIANEGDFVVGLSTSGNSVNIVKAFEVARTKKISTVGFTGHDGGKMKPLSDFLINVPSTDTPRIQESHIMLGHIICQMVEEALLSKMINEAIILAGGLGTRLRDTVPDMPKSMAPVAGHPFLKYVINYYRKEGIQKFIFSLGYKHELIEEYLVAEYSDLHYSCVIENEPLGTGGAIYKSAEKAESSNVLVLNGDTLFHINVKGLSAFHDSKTADCTLCLKEMSNTNRYGIVEIDADKRIQSFKEKSFYEKATINGGVYALNVDTFIKEKFPEKFSFERDYFEKFYHVRKVYGFLQEGYFIDIGIPEDYNKAQHDFKSFT